MAVNPVYENLVNADRVATAHLSMAMIDRAQHQHRHPGVQIAALAATFLLLCERFSVTPQEAFTATKNLMAAHDGRAVEFEAIRMYLHNEVR